MKLEKNLLYLRIICLKIIIRNFRDYDRDDYYDSRDDEGDNDDDEEKLFNGILVNDDDGGGGGDNNDDPVNGDDRDYLLLSPEQDNPPPDVIAKAIKDTLLNFALKQKKPKFKEVRRLNKRLAV